MTFTGLVLRNLRYFWRSHVGVILGVAVATAVIVGALAVGDSVRASLSDIAHRRIGAIDVAVLSGDRFFRDDLGRRLERSMLPTETSRTVATTLDVRGFCKTTSGEARSAIANVHGIEASFYRLAPSVRSRAPGQRRAAPSSGKCHVDVHLAKRLGIDVGSTILVRVERPSAMPRDMVMATIDDVSLALRIEVEALLSDDEFGRFGLVASQVPQSNVFVALDWLQHELDMLGRTNAIYIGDEGLASSEVERQAQDAFEAAFDLEDAGIHVEQLTGDQAGLAELRGRRVFLDTAIMDVAREVRSPSIGILTYFVNEISTPIASESGAGRSTPYSLVAAIGALGAAPLSDTRLEQLVALAGTGPDAFVINDWLAHDLGIQKGADVELAYYVMGNELELRTARTRVRVSDVVALSGMAADRTLMPDFPGLTDKGNCRDWEPGIPIDLDRIRDKDETYWDDHRGTPKAFLPLDRGRALWGNRFGSLTAIRATSPDMVELVSALRTRLGPRDFGVTVRDVRTPALASSTSATDFGGLFAGLSFFLIVAALLLTALLFVFGIEQRKSEIGTLLAIGYRVRDARLVLRLEALVLAGLGSVLGAGLGILYSRLVLSALTTIWSDAVASASIRFGVSPLSVVIGCLASIFVSLCAIAFVTRCVFADSPTELLSSRAGAADDRRSLARVGRSADRSNLYGIVAALAGLIIVVIAGSLELAAVARAGAFFGGGTCFLMAGVFLIRAWLGKTGRSTRLASNTIALALRNAGRRRGRSLAAVCLIAAGTFLVAAIQSQRLEAPGDVRDRDSGTGGFVYLGESTLPVLRDLGSAAGLAAFGLTNDSAEGRAIERTEIVPLRIREGDDASCLNLGETRAPQLFALRPELLAKRRAFRFASVLEPEELEPQNETAGSAWSLLDADYGPGVVPAIGDAASVTWTMKKRLGAGYEYVDEFGKRFEVRIVGTLDGSILQGALIVSEARFLRRYPSASGYRMFLVDVPEASDDGVVRRALTNGLEDVGLQLTSTRDRLAALDSVQNTYLVIFQILGGLGLLLGSAGLGLVVLRNVLERRAELGLLAAVGYAPRDLRRLVVREHAALLGAGLVCGGVAAVIALVPSFGSRGGIQALVPVVAVLTVLGVSGLLWVVLATRVAMREAPLAALRDE
ncbi:MAG: FtsX-like permease family protein [Planctomycetes bacterium]|nr:FtsX-like permease family protein [Planctomycetota bacterium]MCB9890512.1 FtsX-like permease family protein [Planctomycetota bacterium]MCB9917753.1 FtsX-like permease family protein [Planctomycetota bacterium]